MATAKVIHVDGTMEEFKGTVNAGEVAARSPGCFVCSIEAMAIGASAPCVPETEELKFGELYFLMPVSRLRYPLSLHDLCVLAVTASAALCQKTKGAAVEEVVMDRGQF